MISTVKRKKKKELHADSCFALTGAYQCGVNILMVNAGSLAASMPPQVKHMHVVVSTEACIEVY